MNPFTELFEEKQLNKKIQMIEDNDRYRQALQDIIMETEKKESEPNNLDIEKIRAIASNALHEL